MSANYTLFAPWDFRGYPGVRGLSEFVLPLVNSPAEGTGVLYIVKFAKNLMGDTLPLNLVRYAVSTQISLFGDYPIGEDLAPSIVFTVLFGITGFFHFLVFFINFSRGHYFWISFVWGINCIMKLLGFLLRAVWSQDQTKIAVGLTSEVFLIIPSIIFASFDLILAQRLFTWRHPVGGSRRLFWNFMISLYIIVAILVGITIAASFVPYIHLLSLSSWEKWRKVNMFTGVMVIVYSLTSISLIGLSYLFPPTTKDENLYTYQPWWIESFRTFYFVQPGAAQEALESFMKRNHNHRHAVRVIAATHHHFNMVEGLSNQRGNLKHNYSIALISITTLLIFVGSIGRCVVLFQDRIQINLSPACNKWFMYVAWGVFEFIINVLYIIGRVDLRFYRPDRLPLRVRNIITAEQSYFPSEDEDDSLDMLSRSAELYTSDSAVSYPRKPNNPPYPRDDAFGEKDPQVYDDDNISDFHF